MLHGAEKLCRATSSKSCRNLNKIGSRALLLEFLEHDRMRLIQTLGLHQDDLYDISARICLKDMDFKIDLKMWDFFTESSYHTIPE